MDAAFWRERWEMGQTGFHQQEFNAQLVRHWSALGLDTTAPVFVPMCGKSRDMVWLSALGHPILGIEFSDIAVRDFFAEADLTPAQGRAGVFETSTAGDVELRCGDFFALTAGDLEGVRGVYDRAAFVALPPDDRKKYAAHMRQILPTPVSILMITFEYDQPEFTGPPFSVTEQEIRDAYGADFQVDVLERSGPHPSPDHLKARGLESFTDTVVRLVR